MVYLRRQAGQEVFADAPPPSFTSSLLPEAVTPELAHAVEAGTAAQYWQAVTFIEEDGSPSPGIVVGSSVTFPAGAGTYDLFIGYHLADTQDTLSFVQRTLLI